MAGIDPRIIMGLKPVQVDFPSPFEERRNSVALQGLMGQQEMQALQMQQAKRGMADEEAVRSAYQQSGGDSATLRALLQKGGNYKQLQALDKSELENKKTQAGISKDEAAAGKSRFDVAIGKIERGSAILSTAKDQQSWDQARRVMSLNFPELAQQLPEQFDPQFVQAKIAEGMTMAQKLSDERSREGQQITMRGQNISASTAMRGQDLSAATAREGHGVTARGQNISAATAQRGQNLTDTRQREANAVSAATAGLKQRELENTVSTKDAAQESAMASYDTAISTLDRLDKHPGKKAAVGAGIGKTLLPFIGAAPGTDRAGFMRELETFKAQTFLPMVQQLKGMGALSDAEGQKLSAAVGALHEDMPEKEFNASIQLIKKDLSAAKTRASGARPKAAGGKIGGVLTQNADGSFSYGF